MAKPNAALLSFPHNYGPAPSSPLKPEMHVLSVTQLAPQERRFISPAEATKQRPQSPSFLLSSKKVVFSEREKLSPNSVSPNLQDTKFGSHTGNVVIRDALATGTMQDWWQSLMAKSGRTAIDNTMPRPNFDAWFRQCVLCTDMEKPLAWAKATCAKVVGGLNNAVFHTTCTIDNFAECLLLLADSQLVAEAFKGTDIVMSHFVASLRRMTEVDVTLQTKSIISMPWWNKVKSAPYAPPSSAPWNNVHPSRSSYFDSANSTSFALSTEWSVKTSSDSSGTMATQKGDNSFIPPAKMIFKNADSDKHSNQPPFDLELSDFPSKQSNFSTQSGNENAGSGVVEASYSASSRSRPGSAPASRSLHVGLPGSGTAGLPSSPYSRSNAYLATKPVFEMGGTKLQTPGGKITSRRFVADSIMKSYKENAAALVSHSKLRHVSPTTEGEPGERKAVQMKAGSRPQSARPAPKDGQRRCRFMFVSCA